MPVLSDECITYSFRVDRPTPGGGLVSWFINPFLHGRGPGSRTCRSARLDVLPFRAFDLGEKATIDDYCVINNGVGDVRVGAHSRVGISSVVIGPVRIGQQAGVPELGNTPLVPNTKKVPAIETMAGISLI